MAVALPEDIKPDRIMCAEIRVKLLGATPAVMAKMTLADAHGVTYGQSQLHTCSRRSIELLEQLALSLETDFAEALATSEILPDEDE